MAPVVITYGGRCADNPYSTKRVKYVSVRDNGYYEGGARYVAVRRSVPRTRYVAVRDYDNDYAPRYVSVRRQPADVDYGMRYVAVRRQPVYADYGTRYVAVENYVPRQRVVAVHHKEIGDVSYVAVQRIPAVDDYYDRIAPTRTVAVRSFRNSCACPVALRSDLDDVEAMVPARVVSRNDDGYSSVRHVVVKTDYIDGTEQVIVPRSSYDDSAYVDLPSGNVNMTGYVSNTDADHVGTGANHVIENDLASFCAQSVAVNDCDDAIDTTDVSYVPATYSEDLDDQAYFDGGGATYVAADEIEDACLSPVTRTSRGIATTRMVSYVPLDDADDHAFHSGSGVTYVSDTSPTVDYVPIVDDEYANFDADTVWVAGNDADDSCSCPATFSTSDDEAGPSTVSYLSVNDVDSTYADNVTYVPAGDVDYIGTTAVNYAPVDDIDVANVGYVPVRSVGYADTTAIAADDCPALMSSVDTEPFYLDDDSAAVVEEDSA